MSTMGLDLRALRSNLRLASGLVMLAFVVCHLAAHSVTAGNQVLREAGSPDYARLVLEDSNLTAAVMAEIGRMAAIGLSLHLALVVLPFAGRGVRAWMYRRRWPPMLTHPGGRTVCMLPGATVLETLRENGIPHASVCGGRARCTAKIVGALGDTVNTCARLESLTKDYDCSLIVSRRAAEMAGLDLKGRKLHEAPAKGRVKTVQFYALESLPELRA